MADVFGGEDGVVLFVLLKFTVGKIGRGESGVCFDMNVIESADGAGELGGGADEGDLFLIKDGDAITEAFDFGHVMTGHDESFSLFFEGTNDIMQSGTCFDI